MILLLSFSTELRKLIFCVNDDELKLLKPYSKISFSLRKQVPRYWEQVKVSNIHQKLWLESDSFLLRLLCQSLSKHPLHPVITIMESQLTNSLLKTNSSQHTPELPPLLSSILTVYWHKLQINSSHRQTKGNNKDIPQQYSIEWTVLVLNIYRDHGKSYISCQQRVAI